jgi:hypothetical protein
MLKRFERVIALTHRGALHMMCPAPVISASSVELSGAAEQTQLVLRLCGGIL